MVLAELVEAPAMLQGAVCAFNTPDAANCVVPCVCLKPEKLDGMRGSCLQPVLWFSREWGFLG